MNCLWNSFLFNPKQLRIRREQASANLAETEGEKGAHRQTKEALDLSEKTVSWLFYYSILHNTFWPTIISTCSQKEQFERSCVLSLLNWRQCDLVHKNKIQLHSFGSFCEEVKNIFQIAHASVTFYYPLILPPPATPGTKVTQAWEDNNDNKWPSLYLGKRYLVWVNSKFLLYNTWLHTRQTIAFRNQINPEKWIVHFCLSVIVPLRILSFFLFLFFSLLLHEIVSKVSSYARSIAGNWPGTRLPLDGASTCGRTRKTGTG